MRGLLDLVVGVNIQAYSANLDTWSGVAPSADGQSLVAVDYTAMRGLLGFVDPILDKAAPGDIGATTPAAGKFTTLQSGEHTILSDAVGLKLDAAGTTTLYGNGSYLVTNRGMVNPGTLVEVAGKNRSMVYGHDGTYAYLVYQPYVWSGSAWTATNNFGFGLRALQNNTGTDCAGVGAYALYDNAGNACAGLGVNALSANQGASSSGIGSTVLQYNTGDSSIGFGSRTGRYNTGANLVALGHRSAENNIAHEASFVGMRSGCYNTGKQAAGLGYYTLFNNTGDNVVALGYHSGRYNTGNYNTFLGSNIGINFDPNDSSAKPSNTPQSIPAPTESQSPRTASVPPASTRTSSSPKAHRQSLA